VQYDTAYNVYAPSSTRHHAYNASHVHYMCIYVDRNTCSTIPHVIIIRVLRPGGRRAVPAGAAAGARAGAHAGDPGAQRGVPRRRRAPHRLGEPPHAAGRMVSHACIIMYVLHVY
jgi:hypothetical protein